MTVRNHILVGTIARGGSFDVERYMNDARDAVIALAVESEQAAELATSMRKRAHGRYSDPAGTHDYRDRDVRNLKRRAKQSLGVAAKLRELADDPMALRDLVEHARGAAWADVANNLQRRLAVEGMRPDQDPDYESMRDARMQALRLVDLQALSSQQRVRRKREQKAEKTTVDTSANAAD
nr:asparagine synthase [Microbacterium pseudoresistens]